MNQLDRLENLLINVYQLLLMLVVRRRRKTYPQPTGVKWEVK